MAQPQPQQSQVPPRAFSPPQPSPSPAASQHSGFALPPNKRVRTDGPASQPGSPYAASPYAMSPVPVATPPAAAASPAYPQAQAQPHVQPQPQAQAQAQTPPVQAGYHMPYTNGHPPPPPGLSLPAASPTVAAPVMQPPHPAPVQTPIPLPIPMPLPMPVQTPAQVHSPAPVQTPVPLPSPLPMPQYTNATMQPMAQAATPLQTPGIMGPPQKPAERPTRDYEYDVTDSLAGTGIDLRAEEQYMSELYSNAFETIPEARTGFAHYAPGPKSSFYGAGPANQPAQPTDLSQTQYAAQAAEQAWQESAMRLAVQRTQEISDPFLFVALLHRRMEKIAREHHLGLNLELKNNAQSMGKMKLPENFATPKVTVRTGPGPDGTLVETSGSFIPHDAYLVDQLALLSIATKQRLRELVEDANVIAKTRQKTSHGDVPPEWAVAAAPMNAEPLEPMETEDGVNGSVAEGDAGAEGGRSTNPLKRPAEAHDAAVKQPPAKLPKIASYVTLTMRDLARQEREWEEARLRRRQLRKEGLGDGAPSASRAGSAAPGTPGSVAPESEKAMTKKELKKTQAMKAAEASSHANQNLTSSMFAGLGGKGSLFGKGKKGKTYDWMNVGRGGSGASTPTRAAPGPGKGPNGAPGAAASPGNMAMTTEGRNRLGTWREDKEKGKNIQLRDWITVLERDGREAKALQHAYIHLDSSNPK